MQNAEGIKIVERFFEALYDLIEKKALRGKQTFANKYGINRRHLWILEQNKSRDILQLAWIAHLIRDYNVSADWIMTGNGKMYVKEPPKRFGFTNKKRE